ncbi:YgcG family protein [Chromobacterium sp. ASV23]|uniref:TPM domain-containing protein n=1 Tax=Chromobacterium sp. ASV23 TaxID=2795110 RepID=UPI001E64C38D|nr:TPM domain-containing protein [Chromobacterium sp. ASV23]
MSRAWAWLWLALCLMAGAARAELAVPPPTSPVIDQAAFLTDDERGQLEKQLLDFHQRKGSQLAVLIVPSVEPETPFDYGTRVMESWKLGRKGVDDGVLLLIVADTHKTQLLVGRGLEGAIPDIYAKRILQDTLRPLFKQGLRLQGIQAAATQIEGLIDGEKLPEPKRQAAQGDGWADSWLLLAFFLLVGSGLAGRLFGRLIGSFIMGCLSVAASLLLGAATVTALLIGVVAAGLCLVLGEHGLSLASWGNWGGGGGGGRSGDGGSGWSGGGGDFGGGGASGDW